MEERPWKPSAGKALAAAGICAGLLAIFAAMSFKAAYHKGATTDEPLHLVSAWAVLHDSDFRCDPEDPPLWKYWAVAGTRASDMHIDLQGRLAAAMLDDPRAEVALSAQTLYDKQNDADALLRPTRARMVALAVVLGIIMALWAWRLAGPIAAIAATALFCFDPNFMAHAPIVKNDVAISLAITLLLYSVWLLGRRITLARAGAIGICLAMVLSTKFSGVLMVPVLASLLFARAMFAQPWPALRGELAGRWRRLATASIIFIASLLISWGGIWASYRFHRLPTANAGFNIDAQELMAGENENAAAKAAISSERVGFVEETRQTSGYFHALMALERLNLLPQSYVVGLMFTYSNSRVRLGNLLLGKLHPLGAWNYFPLAIAFKTPLATLAAGLAAVALGAVFLRRTKLWHPTAQAMPWWWAAMCLAIFPGLYLASAMHSALNIGIRHVLLVYPFAFIAIGAAAAWAWDRWRPATILATLPLFLILVTENVAAYPDYIPFFNFAAGGQRGGLRLLSDSNIDWGQDLPALADWQRHNPNIPLLLCYFGAADPKYYGIRYYRLHGGNSDPDLPSVPAGPAMAALSATHLQKAYMAELPDEIASSVEGHSPVAVLGGSIYLYSVTLPRSLDVWLGDVSAKILRAAVSKDSFHVAWVAEGNSRQAVVVDGEWGPMYDSIGDSTPTFSPDGTRVAYVAKTGGKQLMVVDGQPGPKYDEIGKDKPVFSPDSKRLGYAARTGAVWRMVVDGQPGPDFDAIGQGSPVFSPDNSRVGYEAAKDGKQLVVVDGQPGPRYDGIGQSSPIFSPDGKRTAYLAAENGKQLVVVDGQPGPDYDEIGAGTLVFSPDSKRVAYEAAKDGKHLVVVDGHAGPAYDGIGRGSRMFSPDGKHVAYLAGKGGKLFAVIDGQPGPEYDGVGDLVFSPDGKRVAYSAAKNIADEIVGQRSRQFVVLDGQPGQAFDGIARNTLLFSPDGQRLTYAAATGNKWKVVVDGQLGPECDGIALGSPIFSPDGKRVAYIAARGGKQVMFVDGQAGPEFEGIVRGSPILSPDSKHVAYAGGAGGRWRVVVDGQVGSDYDAIGDGDPIFSSDSKHVVYRAQTGQKWVAVVDGQPGIKYNRILNNGPQFDAEGAIEFLAVRDLDLYRVRYNPPQ